MSLVRPVQSHGRIIRFSGNGYGGSARLHGHTYCTKLDTTLVRDMLPLRAIDAPLRVAVLSPYASDKTAYSKLQIAATKAEYLVEPEKIAKLLSFWERVKNPVMKSIMRDEANLKKLRAVSPNIKNLNVSPEMFVVATPPPEDNNNSESTSDGGPSLQRSKEEMDSAVSMSSTVTISAFNASGLNSHQQVVDVLGGLSGTSSSHHVSSNTYAVRPLKEYANENDGQHLEALLPDKYPFGLGGWITPRIKKISKLALAKYHLNISGRQFQTPDFVLPLYSLIAKNAVKTKAFVQAKLPSYYANEGDTPRAEVFGKVPLKDMEEVAKYQKQCANAVKKSNLIFLY